MLINVYYTSIRLFLFCRLGSSSDAGSWAMRMVCLDVFVCKGVSLCSDAIHNPLILTIDPSKPKRSGSRYLCVRLVWFPACGCPLEFFLAAPASV